MYPSQAELLTHILEECIYLIEEYSENSFDQFKSNLRLNKAVCRSLEIIGEASSKIHPDLKAKYKLVAWREMSDLRNRIIHHYFGIDFDIIWNTVKEDIPELKEWMEAILKQEATLR